MRILILLSLAGFSGLQSAPASGSERFWHAIDSIVLLDTQITRVEQVAKHPNIFAAATFGLLHHPFAAVRDNCTNYGEYDRYFRAYEKFVEITAAPGGLTRTFYTENRVGLASSWAILRLDSVRSVNGKSHALYFSQAHNPQIEQTWRKYFHRKFRLFSADQRNMRAALFMRAAGDSATRIAFALESSPSVYLPAWVFRVMTRIFFPQLIEDTDKYLYKKRILSRITEKSPGCALQ